MDYGVAASGHTLGVLAPGQSLGKSSLVGRGGVFNSRLH